jgi:phosphoglycolate phosphatase-like HAD superfamily hydrolase|tara:strand:+ start:497 stop:940 length:444 start_codon:yes stop_codon:yes gene_type:complete
MLYIYDLDGTIIDSSHRLGDGSLDDWFANNSPDNIAKDSLLPLAQHLQMQNKKGNATAVCTSRQMTDADYQFLVDNGINPVFILSRKHGDNTSCGAMKLDLIRKFVNRMGYAWGDFIRNAVMFDDNDDVLDTLSNSGMNLIDARKYQ